jgi:hypothetical protein
MVSPRDQPDLNFHLTQQHIAAKMGGTPTIAIATEEGTVYVIDTFKHTNLGSGPHFVYIDSRP